MDTAGLLCDLHAAGFFPLALNGPMHLKVKRTAFIAGLNFCLIGIFTLVSENIFEDIIKSLVIVALAVGAGFTGKLHTFAFALMAATAVVLATVTNAYIRHVIRP